MYSCLTTWKNNNLTHFVVFNYFLKKHIKNKIKGIFIYHYRHINKEETQTIKKNLCPRGSGPLTWHIPA